MWVWVDVDGVHGANEKMPTKRRRTGNGLATGGSCKGRMASFAKEIAKGIAKGAVARVE